MGKGCEQQFAWRHHEHFAVGPCLYFAHAREHAGMEELRSTVCNRTAGIENLASRHQAISSRLSKKPSANEYRQAIEIEVI